MKAQEGPEGVLGAGQPLSLSLWTCRHPLKKTVKPRGTSLCLQGKPLPQPQRRMSANQENPVLQKSKCGRLLGLRNAPPWGPQFVACSHCTVPTVTDEEGPGRVQEAGGCVGTGREAVPRGDGALCEPGSECRLSFGQEGAGSGERPPDPSNSALWVRECVNLCEATSECI